MKRFTTHSWVDCNKRNKTPCMCKRYYLSL